MTYSFSLISSLAVGLMLLIWIRRFAPSPAIKLVGFAGLVALFLVTAGLGYSGRLSELSSFPPPFLFFIMALFAFAILAVVSPWGTAMMNATPLKVLVGMQVFRVLPEILLDLAWREGLAPIQMTYHGRNWDILTAITALILVLIWPRLKRPHQWALAHAILGLVLVFNILAISILSSPLPIRVFMNEPANTFVTLFPYVWLPGIHVVTALVLHGLALRRVAFENSRDTFS